MISLNLVLLLLTAHFIADFVCQTDWMAKGKSSDNGILTIHVSAYMLVLLFTILIVQADWIHTRGLDWLALRGGFVAINAGMHWVTDYVTSRITKHLWAKGEVHWFFVVIGADQLIHVAGLLVTAHWMGL